MALQIPTPENAALASLVRLSQSEHERLRDALHQARPRLNVKRFAEEIAEHAHLPVGQILEYLRMLLNLYLTLERDTKNFDELLDAVSQIAAQSMSAAGISQDADLRVVKTRLGELLAEHATLGLVANALSVRGEHHQVLDSARILTDLRPVFPRVVDDRPDAAMIVHTLKLEVTRDGKSHRIFVAPDSEDVKALQEAFERAIRKERTLLQLTSDAHLVCLGSGE